MTITNNFQKLDYGAAGNLIHYGQPTPPQYDLGKMHVPVALFTGLDFSGKKKFLSSRDSNLQNAKLAFIGSNDYLADPADVLRLISELPTPPVLVHNEPSYAHLDPLWAPSAKSLIYPTILKLLDKYNGISQ